MPRCFAVVTGPIGGGALILDVKTVQTATIGAHHRRSIDGIAAGSTREEVRPSRGPRQTRIQAIANTMDSPRRVVAREACRKDVGVFMDNGGIVELIRIGRPVASNPGGVGTDTERGRAWSS